ncbi:hypothetical protein KY290_020297 [Solanum tuberosum]|uniref:F-box domain-containing protein n=1 Tax=Solanum tuberosum TaxID=4113 RepID=A0ABQ7V004_SOLTU|nr:hypothetical protein KY290_020297 [Solanum tuberosum]
MTEAPCRRTCDIISNLPDDVTDVILMCLPLQDAIRTSILSRKWRYRWAKVPKLTLDHTLWEYISTRKVRARLNSRILYHLFSLRQGPINECRISNIPEPIHFCEIDKLIFFVSRNELEQLVLELPKGEKYKLPSSIFTCSKMRHLTLHYCVVNPPPTFQAFSKLIRLQLLNVAISDKSLENLISRCPMLEDMELDIADPLNYIEINAPKLRSLNFGSKLNSICFKNTPLLTDVSIIMANDVNHDSVNRGTCNLVEFFGSLPALKNLCLGHSIIKTLITGIIDRIPVKLPMPLVNLRQIYLFDICLSDLDEIRCLLCLIKSSPYLEEIIVIINQAINNERGDDLTALKLLEAGYDSGIKLNRLTKVRLIDIRGTKAEMEFIKLLLATSPVLEKMMISPYYIGPESPQTLVEILMQANTFQRASPRAVVNF